jgi:hypothetical protein
MDRALRVELYKKEVEERPDGKKSADLAALF